MRTAAVRELLDAVSGPDQDLATLGLAIARLIHPRLETRPYLARLDEMGAAVGSRIAKHAGDVERSVSILNEYLFGEEGFRGNEEDYEDPRNSFLNEVIDRRTGIPITLAIVYIEVARRAGMRADGISFPGHFLVRVPAQPIGFTTAEDLIVDPFERGAVLGAKECRRLLRRYLGNDGPLLDPRMLPPASRKQIAIRMLLTLKHAYVRLRSFPQARDVAGFLLAVDPSASTELRDRGLLAYHLEDFASALRDLEAYLRLSPPSELEEENEDGEESGGEREQIWEHVKALRRRVAEQN
jgi:regulator of sirC expression with transglutaminase-like and TPR domain